MPGRSLRRMFLSLGLASIVAAAPGVVRADDEPEEEPAPAAEPVLDAAEIKQLVDRLVHGDNKERDRAHKLLGRGGKAVVAPLIEVLKGPDSTAGAWAAEALALVGKDAIDAAEALAAGLGRDGMDWPCANALEALGAAGIPGLVGGLAFVRSRSRLAALVSLAKIGPLPASTLVPLMNAMRDPDEEIRSAAAGCLAKLEARPAVRLAAISAFLADPSSSVRSTVVHALVEAVGTEPGAVLPLALLTGDPDDHIRRAATEAVAKVPRGEDEREVVENTLSRSLGDREGDVRAAAIEAFVDSGLDDEGMRGRISLMTDDPDAGVRVESLRAIGRATSVDDATRQRLEKGLVDRDARVKVAAAAALARAGIDVERALDFLFGEEGIYHAVKRVRIEVVRAAGELGAASAAARKRLDGIRADRAEKYRSAAEDALRRIDEATKK